MKLFQSMASPFAARVRLMIYLKNLEVEFATGDWQAAFKQRAPTGKIPTLELDDGHMIPESEVICEYLEDCFPEPSAFPAHPLDRATARLIARHYDLYINASLEILAGAIGKGEKPPQAQLDQIVAALGLWLQRIEDLLGAGPYAVGDRLSHADGVLLPLVRQLRLFRQITGLPIPLEDMPRLAGHNDAVVAADPVAARIAAEIDEAYAQATAMVEQMVASWESAPQATT